MADWEKELSPIMREKLARIGEVTPEDKERMTELDNLDSLLREFYRGELGAQGLWERLKEFEKQGKQFLLRDAYTKLKSSFRWKGLPMRFEETDDSILSIEFREEEGEKGELVLELSDSNLEEALREHQFLVIDCWAEWCAPCRIVAPIIEELAKDYQGKIVFGKLNVDHNRATVAQYRIMSIPTLLIFKDGQLVDQKTGAIPRQMLEPDLVKHL